MKTTAQRKAHYEARMLSSLLDPVLSARIASQVASFNSYADDFVPKQVALRAILNDEGISVIDVAGYEAFHGELYHASRSFSGPALQAEFCVLVVKWADTAHLGAAAETILERIGADLYTLDPCGSP